VKGALFLKSLEKAFGRDRFDEYLRNYFAHFSFQSVTTEEAITYLKNNLLDQCSGLVARTSLREWVYEPGLPPLAPLALSESLDRIRKQAEEWHNGNANHLRTEDWSAHEWLHFLRSLPSEVGSERMRKLDETFHLTQRMNAEIMQQWLLMVVRNQYQPAYPRLGEFLATVGRRIYIKPLYEELVKTEAGKKLAEEIYSRVRSSYHPISQAAIDKIVRGNNGSEDQEPGVRL